ncbi:FG-GAP repeat protein [Dokdonella ginsengisoli]|uniref:FG-GAP repeat protein n=1 Tax=Dokdonella ginsengisoli TaxID=363846 RepID=A0ABV9QXH9_9GAMM
MTFRYVCLAFSFSLVAAAHAAGDSPAAPASLSASSAEAAQAMRESTRQSYLGDQSAAPKAAGQDRTATDSPLVPFAWNEQAIRVTDGTAFGAAIAASGNIVFIGAPSTSSYQGVAYVYQRSSLCSIAGVCAWEQKQRLVAGDAAPYSQFGGAVAFDGTTAFVGAGAATVDGQLNRGAVYVFSRGDTRTFGQVQKLVAPDGQPEDCFGRSVAVAGDDALVGAPFCSGTNYVLNGHGAVYRYRRGTDGVWTIAQKIVASDGGFAESFGGAVAITADTAMIGASSAFQFGYYGVGAVYVYKKQCFPDGRCNPAWREEQKLIGSPTSTGMEFGGALAFDGTTLLVGAQWALTGDEGLPLQLTSGAVYAFTQTDGRWVQTQQLLASDSYRNWRFGASIALNGTTAIVGATGVGWPTASKGAAYAFSLSNGSWSEIQKLEASDGTANDGFGARIAIAGAGAVLIGSPQGLNNSGQGTVYIYKQP